MSKIHPNLSGKSVVVTGATSGIGLQAAEEFAQQGAFVIGIGRSELKNEQATTQILRTNPKGQVVYLLADLAHQRQILELGDVIPSVLARHGYEGLNVLINNAGVYLEKKQLTDDGVEMTFAVNHLAAFLLTFELLPHLQRSTMGRVMTVSSYSHRTTPLNLKKITNPCPYIGLLAYKRSKLCNVLFTYELNRLGFGVLALAVDPGLVNTEIADKGESGISAWVWRRRRHKGTSSKVPVKTLLYLAQQTPIDTSYSYYFRDCEALMPSYNARREDLAKDLWGLSRQLTNLQWS
jgi:NAD(P)-dependent dehydrogenase (short-subunit alcohol dehydrogenase family)